MSCKNCQYLGEWQDNEDGWDNKVVAECKRYPPIAHPDSTYGFFSLIFIDEGPCGEWRAKRVERGSQQQTTQQGTQAAKKRGQRPLLKRCLQ